MNYLIIAFKSRNSLYAFVKNLQLYGISASVVNTPRAVSVSCGLSARADYRYINAIKSMLANKNYDGFLGIYHVSLNGAYERVEKIF